MTDTKPDIPFKSPAVPAALRGDHRFRFDCRPGISCFNACCRQADVTLAPYDILRLARRFGLTSAEFIRKYAVPFQLDQDGLPGLKLKTDDAGTCLHMDEEKGCTVYSDRPSVCRYYPLGLLSLREKDTPRAEQHYSLIKEDICKGHEEAREQTIDAYRSAQGLPEYDAHNQGWYELILKKKSAGPTVGKPPMTSLQLFFLACYDLDNFRRFVLSPQFQENYVLDPELKEHLERDDEALLEFAYRFLRQVLFGEKTLREREGAWERRVEQRKELWQAQVEMERARRAKAEDEKYQERSCSCDE